ncbi:hypothetical protein Tco_0411868 [Tanacetum coccineum]
MQTKFMLQFQGQSIRAKAKASVSIERRCEDTISLYLRNYIVSKRKYVCLGCFEKGYREGGMELLGFGCESREPIFLGLGLHKMLGDEFLIYTSNSNFTIITDIKRVITTLDKLFPHASTEWGPTDLLLVARDFDIIKEASCECIVDRNGADNTRKWETMAIDVGIPEEWVMTPYKLANMEGCLFPQDGTSNAAGVGPQASEDGTSNAAGVGPQALQGGTSNAAGVRTQASQIGTTMLLEQKENKRVYWNNNAAREHKLHTLSKVWNKIIDLSSSIEAQIDGSEPGNEGSSMPHLPPFGSVGRPRPEVPADDAYWDSYSPTTDEKEVPLGKYIPMASMQQQGQSSRARPSKQEWCLELPILKPGLPLTKS